MKPYGQTTQKVTGNNTNVVEAAKCNGEYITQICYQQNMIPMNTWKRAPLDAEDKIELRDRKTKEQTLNQIQPRNRNTWISPSGQISRQIDYIIINHAYRNIVTRTWPIQ